MKDKLTRWSRAKSYVFLSIPGIAANERSKIFINSRMY